MSNNIIDKIQLSGVTYDIGGQGGSGVSVVEVTQAEYDALPSSAKTDTSKMYVITDAEAGDLTNYYTKTETNTLLGGKADTATTYTKTEVDTALGGKADTATTYTKQEVDNAITAATTTKQDTLVSGTNIKTINNISILGSGNINIQGGGGKAIEAGRGISVTTGETADTVSFNLPISAGTGTSETYIAIGVNAYAQEGYKSFLTNAGGISIGSGSSANRNSIIIGNGAVDDKNGGHSISIGTVAKSKKNSISIGDYSESYGTYNEYEGSIAIGYGTTAKNIIKALAIGTNVSTTGTTKTNINNQLKIDTSNQIYIMDKTNTNEICLQDYLGGGGGGGKTVSGGTNISITTGETADTINCTLPMFSGSAVGASKINHTDNVASGLYSNAEGQFTTASTNSAHAEGNRTTASGDYSHAEGYKTTASENSAHAEGGECVASGQRSHAEGYKTTASTYNSHTEGYYTVAYNASEHSNGMYNVSNTGSTTADKTLFSVGNGTSNSARHNAFEIRQNGDIYLTKDGRDVKLQDQLGGGGGKAIEAGRGISITTGETADTVSFNLPISGGSGEGSIIGGFSGNTASGKYSFALGGRYESRYDYQYCSATGKGAISFGGTASGQGAFSCGENPQALGFYSVAFGNATKAIGIESFVIGRNTSANTFASFAQGRYTKTTNEAEVALGEYNNSVSGSSTFGNSGNTLFSVGNGTANNARHNAFEIRQNGDIYLTKDGQDVKLQDQLGGSSYTAGDGIDITNDVISVTGKVDTSTYNTYTAATDAALATKQTTLTAGTNITIVDNVISATGGGGGSTYTAGRGINITNDTISFSLPISAGTGTNSIIENYTSNVASGSYSHAEGRGTTAGTGSYTHAEGYNTKASGSYSHAEGASSLASGSYTHAEGSNTKASGQYSHAEGYYTTASTDYTHAEGYNTKASGRYSHAEGSFTTAKNEAEHASGQYNVSSSASTTFGDSGNTLFSVGNGTNSARHNAFEIRQNGDIYYFDGTNDVKLQDKFSSIDTTIGDINTILQSI